MTFSFIERLYPMITGQLFSSMPKKFNLSRVQFLPVEYSVARKRTPRSASNCSQSAAVAVAQDLRRSHQFPWLLWKRFERALFRSYAHPPFCAVDFEAEHTLFLLCSASSQNKLKVPPKCRRKRACVASDPESRRPITPLGWQLPCAQPVTQQEKDLLSSRTWCVLLYCTPAVLGTPMLIFFGEGIARTLLLNLGLALLASSTQASQNHPVVCV